MRHMVNNLPGLPTPPRLRFAEPPLLEKEGKFSVGKINGTSNQSVIFKRYCIDLSPLPRGTAGVVGRECIFFIQHLKFNI
jgi:hypothetical protein